jgi:hypothetical protein
MPVPTVNIRPPDRVASWLVAAAVLVLAGLEALALADPSAAHSEQGFGPPPAWQLRVQPVACALGEIEFASGPGTNAFDERIYVLLRDHALILRMGPTGRLTFFADLNHAWHPGSYLSPTFDVVGHYDESLLLLAEPYHIGEIDANTGVSFFAPGGIESALGQNLELRCDPHGAFGGQLFLLDSDGLLCTVNPGGMRELFATGLQADEHDMLFSSGGAFGDGLYIAETESRRILRVQPDHEIGTPAAVWRDLDDLGISPVSMTICREGIFGTDVMYVSDTEGRIIRLSAAGAYHGVLLADLPGPAQIDIPASATFPDCMIVAAAGSIWILYYEHVDLAGLGEDVDQGGDDDDGGDSDSENESDDDVTLDVLIMLLGDPEDPRPTWVSDLAADGVIDFADLATLFDVSP